MRTGPRGLVRCAVAAILGALGLLSAPAIGADPESFDCVIDPSRVVKLSSPVIGMLAEVLVERGDRVSEGQIVARLESTVEAREVDLARARAEATPHVDAQQERVSLASKTYERGNRMAESDAMSEQQRDELRSQLRLEELELAQVKHERILARLAFERAKAVLEQRTIRSPVSGVVTARRLSPGEFVDNDTYIIEVAQLDPLYVEVFMPVSLHPRVEEGGTALVEPQAPFGERYEATILTVDRVIDAASGTFGVRLGLPNSGETLPAGLRCRVTLPGDTSGIAQTAPHPAPTPSP